MSSYPITDDERNRLLSHSRITVALALAAADAKNDDQVAGVSLALHRIAGEILNASWGFDKAAFVAEVERMAQAEIDRQKSMAAFGRQVSKAMVAEAKAAKAERKSTREMLDAAAADNGWTLLRDEGYFVQYGRGEHELITLHFSDDDAGRGVRQLTDVYNQYPTGDRMAADGRVGYTARALRTRDKGKRAAALEWFAETHYAKPGTNALLAKLGMEPVLPEAGA